MFLASALVIENDNPKTVALQPLRRKCRAKTIIEQNGQFMGLGFWNPALCPATTCRTELTQYGYCRDTLENDRQSLSVFNHPL